MIGKVSSFWAWAKVLALSCALSLFSAGAASAGMENAKFALHRMPKFSPSQEMRFLCDDPSTPSFVEPNYSPNFSETPCSEYTVTGPLGASQVYVVVAEAGTEGVGGVSFGVDYDGRDPDGLPGTGDETGISPKLVTWTPCADGLSFPNDNGYGEFPNPRGGLRMTWILPGSCASQTIGGMGVHAVAGSFYVYAYSPDVLRLTANLGDEGLAGQGVGIADCSSSGVVTEFYGLKMNSILGRVQFGSGAGGYNPCATVPSQPATWGRLKGLFWQP